MGSYYCHKCATEESYLNPSGSENLNFTGSAYQLTKFLKHTLPVTQSGLVSVFVDPSYLTYKDYTVNTLFSGSVEIDDSGRKNILWLANENAGSTFLDGAFQNSGSLIKVVLPDDVNKIHAYPIDSGSLVTRVCSKCGKDILTGSLE
ncbi:MAG: hypothetical protein CMP48_24475 [Rickettsiales bacterium]|nr:hypothetical protein [Rickettsiales bacterium]